MTGRLGASLGGPRVAYEGGELVGHASCPAAAAARRPRAADRLRRGRGRARRHRGQRHASAMVEALERVVRDASASARSGRPTRRRALLAPRLAAVAQEIVGAHARRRAADPGGGGRRLRVAVEGCLARPGGELDLRAGAAATSGDRVVRAGACAGGRRAAGCSAGVRAGEQPPLVVEVGLGDAVDQLVAGGGEADQRAAAVGGDPASARSGRRARAGRGAWSHRSR